MVVTHEPGLLPPLHHHERMRLRSAAFAAKRRYPGPVGELVAKEIAAWEEFGYRIDGHGLVARLVDDLLKPQANRNG